MKFLQLRRLVTLFVGAIGLLFTSSSGAAPAPTPVVLAKGGVQMSLSTSAYRFSIVGDSVETSVKGRGSAVPRQSFAASVVLGNLSRTDVTFMFPNAPAAERRFTFRILDSAGTMLWESEPDIGPAPVLTPATLKKQSRWARTMQIPLKLDSGWLAPGRYSLEASVVGQLAPKASTLFEVVWPADPTGTGIKGQVFQALNLTLWVSRSVEVWRSPFLAVPVKALVTIEEYQEPGHQYFRAPTVWKIETDDAGNYELVAPPGRYTVSAQKFFAAEPRVSPSYLVEVVPGQFTLQHLYLPAEPFSRAQLIMSVGNVTAQYVGPVGDNSGAVKVLLTAQGMVTSGGWTEPALRLRPSLGTSTALELDFVADPPTGAATLALAPIATTQEVVCPPGLTKIRVHDQAGHVEIAVPTAPE